MTVIVNGIEKVDLRHKKVEEPKYEEGDITIDERLSLFNYVSSRMNEQRI